MPLSENPSKFCLGDMQPDLTAPGADTLAAWCPLAPPSIYLDDSRRVKFSIISGTSMSCPHATGAAAYVKAAHPDWSTAAIKSGLMTTGDEMFSPVFRYILLDKKRLTKLKEINLASSSKLFFVSINSLYHRVQEAPRPRICLRIWSYQSTRSNRSWACL